VTDTQTIRSKETGMPSTNTSLQPASSSPRHRKVSMLCSKGQLDQGLQAKVQPKNHTYEQVIIKFLTQTLCFPFSTNSVKIAKSNCLVARTRHKQCGYCLCNLCPHQAIKEQAAQQLYIKTVQSYWLHISWNFTWKAQSKASTTACDSCINSWK